MANNKRRSHISKGGGHILTVVVMTLTSCFTCPLLQRSEANHHRSVMRKFVAKLGLLELVTLGPFTGYWQPSKVVQSKPTASSSFGTPMIWKQAAEQMPVKLILGNWSG